ncbi:GNAT family N-acetyltransferase [Streptomyces sp. C10-9-1]|uniref:GNAT family N-acetyltransferase n=1 Tax=Streptomyces sp. C10-9-1 TaxID=1859285 RepID=UPI0021115475|nr:GNAT family N-acetyltransferase [Streptomyces sp. C10-9-1]MCQ6555729.1 GNAT family N-acetyltransferase [Streptomyces sp. C10-9-1]
MGLFLPSVRAIAQAYLSRHPGELRSLAGLLAHLAAPAGTAGPSGPRGRCARLAPLTCTAVVVDRDRRVLHTLRGGTPCLPAPCVPVEAADRHLADAALRGLSAETGILPGDLCLTPRRLREPLDIAVHDVDADPGTGEPGRRRYDFRFLFPLVPGCSVHRAPTGADGGGARWLPLSEVACPALRAKLPTAGTGGRGAHTPPEAPVAARPAREGRDRSPARVREARPAAAERGVPPLRRGDTRPRRRADGSLHPLAAAEGTAHPAPGSAPAPSAVGRSTAPGAGDVAVPLPVARGRGPGAAGTEDAGPHRPSTAVVPDGVRPGRWGGVRAATPEDAEAIVRMRSAHILAEPLSEEWIRRCATELAPRLGPAGDARAFVVDAPDGALASCALGLVHSALPTPDRPRGLAARLHIVATRPDLRRRGCARAAVSALVDHLAEKEHVTLFEVDASVEAAPLYRELGFTGSPVSMRMTRPEPPAADGASGHGSGWMPPERYAETVLKATAFACVYYTDEDDRPLQLHSVYSPAHPWQLVGGTMDPGERPWETAVRECREETGLTPPSPPRLLATVYGLPGAGWPYSSLGTVFDGGRLTPAQIRGIVLDPREHDEVRVLPLDGWRALMPPGDFARLSAVERARRTGEAAYFGTWDWEE